MNVNDPLSSYVPDMRDPITVQRRRCLDEAERMLLEIRDDVAFKQGALHPRIERINETLAAFRRMRQIERSRERRAAWKARAPTITGVLMAGAALLLVLLALH